MTEYKKIFLDTAPLIYYLQRDYLKTVLFFFSFFIKKEKKF